MTWRTLGYRDDEATARIPTWLTPLASALPTVNSGDVTRFVPVEGSGRHAAVLVLFGDGPDVLLIERARGSDAHSGQPAFPGGVAEAIDADATSTALREAQEETGVDVGGITIFGGLPDLWVPVSDFVVSPVLGWWHEPSEVAVQDTSEVSRVERVAVNDLVNPANRCTALHPSGYRGPGFLVNDMLVWGFTAGVLAGILDYAGWSREWDSSRTVRIER
jgi:8-oxo-dGTP pyrophosphatase MutT (NUDIX family)